MIPKLVIATSNKGKIAELKVLLEAVATELIPISQLTANFEPEETGQTFHQNAMIKASEGVRISGLPTFAEDSGLMVDALGGAPGVYSARFYRHGDDKGNNELLLKKLEGVTDRRARFVCAAVLAFPDGRTVSAQGSTEGRILTAPEGSSGFGYDPVFFSDELNKCFGLATQEEKNSVSHRKKATAKLIEKLKAGQYD